MTLDGVRIGIGDIGRPRAGMPVRIEVDEDVTFIGIEPVAGAHGGTHPVPRRPACEPGKPFVSVVVTSFNVEDYIGATLMSALAQTYPNIEVIVIDDASTDDTWAILQELRAGYDCIKLIRNERNLGGSLSKRVGLDAVTGDYVLFCDGDDLLSEGAVSAVVEIAMRENADCVMFGFDHFDTGSGHSFGAYSPQAVSRAERVLEGPVEIETRSTSRLSHILPICLLETATHAAALSSVIFDLRYYYDLPTFFSVIAASRRLVLVDDVLYHYRLGRPGQSVENWATTGRGLKMVSLLNAVRLYLASRDKWDDRHLRFVAMKLLRLTAGELACLRPVLTSKEYKATIRAFGEIWSLLPWPSIVGLAGDPRWLILALALRWRRIKLVRLLLRRELR